MESWLWKVNINEYHLSAFPIDPVGSCLLILMEDWLRSCSEIKRARSLLRGMCRRVGRTSRWQRRFFTVLKTDTLLRETYSIHPLILQTVQLRSNVLYCGWTCSFVFYELVRDALNECFCDRGPLAPQSDLVSPPPTVSVSHFSPAHVGQGTS